jgi:protein O-mannosyl-transferase
VKPARNVRLPGAGAWSAALAAATCLAFLPVLGAGWVDFDDGVNFLRNPRYRGFSAENLAWMFSDMKGHYMPLTWLTLALDYVLWGLDARGYHATNLAFHAANGVLFFGILDTLLRRAGTPAAPARRAAAIGALLYAIHPLRVESVAWVTERRDVLCGLFFLLSIRAYLSALDDPAKRRRRLGWALAFFALSLLSKAMSMALPFVLLILDVYPLRRFDGRAATRREVLLEKLPFFFLFAAAVALTYATQVAAGAMVAGAQYATIDRLTQPGYRIGFYVVKTLVPAGLQPAYLWPDDPAPLRPWAAAGVVAGLAATATLWRVRRRWPAALGAWLAFGVLLAPVAGFFQAGPHFAADRYTYFAGLAAAALGAAAVARGLPVWAAAVVLVLLGGLCFRQAGVWTSSATLWGQALAVDPDNVLARTNRGLQRSEAGDLAGALEDFDAALRRAPNQPRVHAGRARVLLQRGDGAGALAASESALRLDERFAPAWETRGVAKMLLRDLDGALKDLETALQLTPDSAVALSNRATLLAHRGAFDAALADLDRALAVDGSDTATRLQRAETLERRGRPDDRRAAAEEYRRVLARAPAGSGPHRQAAAALERLNR